MLNWVTGWSVEREWEEKWHRHRPYHPFYISQWAARRKKKPCHASKKTYIHMYCTNWGRKFYSARANTISCRSQEGQGFYRTKKYNIHRNARHDLENSNLNTSIVCSTVRSFIHSICYYKKKRNEKKTEALVHTRIESSGVLKILSRNGFCKEYELAKVR